MSLISVDLDDPTPPYEQLRRGILAAVRAGELQPGDRLPAIRALARDLALANGTVARTYRELDAAGVITTGRAAGTRIADPLPAEITGAGVRADDELVELLADAVSAARDLGADDIGIRAALERALLR